MISRMRSSGRFDRDFLCIFLVNLDDLLCNWHVVGVEVKSSLMSDVLVLGVDKHFKHTLKHKRINARSSFEESNR